MARSFERAHQGRLPTRFIPGNRCGVTLVA